MVTRRIDLNLARASGAFTWGETKILEWQFSDGREEGFFTKLLRALAHADPENEERLLVAFPDLREAWESFRLSGAFGKKCRAHGIDL